MWSCASCKEVISGQAACIFNKYYHSHCFSCATCNKSLSGQQCLQQEGKLLCISCGAPPCAKCKQPVSQGGVKAIDNVWHQNCFVCSKCQKGFLSDGGKFFTQDNKPYCVRCSRPQSQTLSQTFPGGPPQPQNNSNNQLNKPNNKLARLSQALSNLGSGNRESKTCHTCHNPLLPHQNVFFALKNGYHQECFQCIACKVLLADGKFVTLQGKPACQNCAVIKLAKRCDSCSQPITSQIVSVFDKKYHPECLKCGACHNVIVNLQKIYRKNGNPCCPSCVEGVFNDVSGVVPSSPNTNKASRRSMVRRTLKTPQQLIVDLDSLLSDDRGINALLKFMTSEYSVENILFILDVFQFKELVLNPHDLKIYCKSIYQKYIAPNAELEINIDAPFRAQVQSRLLSPSRDMFDPVLTEITKLITLCTFPRFLQSPECKELLIQR